MKETMNIKNPSADHDLEALRAAIAGQVSVPGQSGYDQARQAWNLAVDEHPSVVVVAASASDVVQAVQYARGHGMRIAPQGTGHGAAPLEPLDGRCCSGRRPCGTSTLTRLPAPQAPRPARCGRT